MSQPQYVMAYIEVPMMIGTSSSSTDSFEIMREHMKIRFETLSELPNLDPNEASVNNDTWKELASLLIPTAATLSSTPTIDSSTEPIADSTEYALIPPRDPSITKSKNHRKRERMTFRQPREKISKSSTQRIYP